MDFNDYYWKVNIELRDDLKPSDELGSELNWELSNGLRDELGFELDDELNEELKNVLV